MEKRIILGGKNIPAISGLEAPMYSGLIELLDSEREHDKSIKSKLESIGIFSKGYYIDAKISDELKLKASILEIEKNNIRYMVYNA